MSDVLADAGPLVALAFTADQYHLAARADLERFAAERTRVYVSFITVVESCTLILRRATPRYAFRWYDSLRARADFLNPTEGEYLTAIELVRRYGDQPISIADGVTAVVSRRLGLPAWTYDHHFDVMRVDRWR